MKHFKNSKEKFGKILFYSKKVLTLFFNTISNLIKAISSRRVGYKDSSLRILFIVIFAYSLTITFHFLYLQYFGVPYEFLNYGIKENTTFFLTFFLLLKVNIWMSLLIISFIFLTLYVLFWEKIQFLIISFIASCLWLTVSLSDSTNFEGSKFYTFSEECKAYQAAKDNNRRPLILTHNSGKYVTVYIDDKNRLLPGFSLEEPEPYPCVIFQKELGKVIK